MDYGFNLKYDTPDFISWAQVEREHNDKRAQERMQNYINLMKMLGRGAVAYKMNKELNDWQADQEYWNDESDMLDMISGGYYAPDDFDVDSMLSINPEGYINSKRKANPYWVPGKDSATQTDYALWQLGLK